MKKYLPRWDQIACPLTALCLLASTTSGCAFTQSTTSIRTVADPPVPHLRLTRADSTPMSGAFKQDGHAVVGQLTLRSECANELEQNVHRQRITETRANRATGITWVVIGGVLTAVGTGFLIASASADHRVYCGNGDASGPKDGDQCSSLSGAESTVGYAVLLMGLITGTAGGINLARKPQIEASDLPAEHITRVTAPVACGSSGALDGLVLAIELPGNGKWTGRVASDGSVRIDVSEKIPLPEQATVSVLVDSVPASLTALLKPGLSIGTVTLSGAHPSVARPKLAARH